MKVHLMLSAIVILCSEITHAQTLHLRAGITHATLDWTYVQLNGSRTEQYKAPLLGYSVGVGAEYFDKGLFSLSSDLWVYRSGGQFTDTEKEQRPEPGRVGFGDPEQIQVNYAAFSTCANFNPINGKTKLQLQLGPRIDFLFSGTDKDPLRFVDNRDGLSKVNYGFNLGLGLYKVTEKWEYGLQATWLNRLKKLADLEGAVTPSALLLGRRQVNRFFCSSFRWGIT